MRFLFVVCVMGCGGSSMSPDIAFDTAGSPEGLGCLELGPALLRLDSGTPSGTVTITGDCGVSLSVDAVLDDPAEAFQVTPLTVMAGVDETTLTVSLVATEPGDYQALLGIETEGEFSSSVELRGVVTAE